MSTRRAPATGALLRVRAGCVLVTAGCLAALVLAGCSPADQGASDRIEPAARVAPDAGATTAEVEDAVLTALGRRAHAWREGDGTAWATTVDGTAQESQADVFGRLRRLHLDRWAEHLTAIEPGPNGSWRAEVLVRYRLDGDRQDALVRAVLDLSPDLLVRGSTTTPLPPWEIDGVRTVAGDTALVVGGAAPGVLRRYADELDRAASSVGSLLDQTAPRVVLVVPATWDQARRMVGAGVAPGLAAVTTSLEPAGVPAGPVRVLADPGVLAGLDRQTRIAVLGHEAFHVATAGLGAVPLWLSEGLADYAGYRESGIALERASAGLERQVRRDGVPSALPDDAAFGAAGQATSAYEGAHVAVAMLTAEYGPDRIVSLYRQVARDGPHTLDAALRDVLGTDLTAVTAAWRAEVTASAGD
ncbi:MAG: peptidase MA family metallohydrolase [Jiangellaceae bacterium]